MVGKGKPPSFAFFALPIIKKQELQNIGGLKLGVVERSSQRKATRFSLQSSQAVLSYNKN